MKIITTNEKIQPVIDHIKTMQDQIAELEAELKQYKTLLWEDYMKDAAAIVSMAGRKLAIVVESTYQKFNKDLFKAKNPDEFSIYEKYLSELPKSYIRIL